MKLPVTGLAFKVHGEWDNAAFLGTADAPATHFQVSHSLGPPPTIFAPLICYTPRKST